MKRKILFLFSMLATLALCGVAMAFPRNNSWHTAAWGDRATVRGEGGGIYGTGGQSDSGIHCSGCHVSTRIGSCTDPSTGLIDFNLTASPSFGSVAGGDSSYVAGRRYQITLTMTGEHLGDGTDQNGMAATVEDASGNVVGRFITDSGADSASCTTDLPVGMTSHEGPGTTFVYGDCHGVLSVIDQFSPKRTRWVFDWVAPAAGAGDLSLYVAMVDGDTEGLNSTCDDTVERVIPLVEE